MSLKNLLRISSKVQEALSRGRPVIALESAIISHEIPYPQNLSTALELEKLAESLGVMPATVALMDGAIRVGLSEPELQILARSGPGTKKVTRMGLGSCLARRELGATTASATMFVAALAGVRVFATWGVRRGSGREGYHGRQRGPHRAGPQPRHGGRRRRQPRPWHPWDSRVPRDPGRARSRSA
jgi:pseudouridine-5'-phosphate glycosidase